MFKKNEYKVLEKLFDDLSRSHTINQLSLALGQKYMQTHRTIKELYEKNVITLKKVGNNLLVGPDFSIYHPEYICVEIQRTLKADKSIIPIYKELCELDKDFVCILFGSYANNTHTKNSDIDLLFIQDEPGFEREIRSMLSLYNVDVQVINEKSLFEMWGKNELNVGNEILKKHMVLFGYEQFLTLLRKKNGY
ncbi:MAG: nucleotidyltransferase domain-containing protein [Nanoarchaeota archaeon]